MISLAEFLLARIADDEEAARYVESSWASLPSGQRALAECAAKRRVVEQETSSRIMYRRKPWHSEAFSPYYFHLLDDVGNVIAEDDEARRLVAQYSDPVTDTLILRILAEVYADHPDYQPEWAPNQEKVNR